MLKFDKEIIPAVEAERARNKRGTYTFYMYWVMKKPETAFLVRWLETGDYDVGIVYALTEGTFAKPSENWITNCWTLNYEAYAARVLST